MGPLMDEVKATQVESNQVAIWWIGQAGYVVKTSGGKVIFHDPFMSELDGPPEGFERLVPPPISPDEVVGDLYMCTHNHEDHTDLPFISKITNKDKITFVGPRNSIKALSKIGILQKNLLELNVGDQVEIFGIKIKGTFCIPNAEGALDTTGFLLTLENGITLYHTSDTDFHPFLFYLSKYPIDIMFVCINGKMGNIGIDDAIELTRYLKPKVVVPNHYGMFARNTADPFEFSGKLSATGSDPICKIFRLGEKYVYSRSAP